MVIHKPPYYRYSLFKPWDKEAFELIKKIARNKNYPTILGTTKDKNQFLITLIRTQKSLHDWRLMLIDILKQVKNTGKIDTRSLNKKYPPKSIGKNISVWVTYKEDKIVSDFIDELKIRKVSFQGTDKEISEFVMRFILGQLGHDWEQTIMMVWEMLGDGNNLYVKKLNKEMKNFDHIGMFE